MFIINGTDYTLCIIGIIGALLFFVVQLILCLKAKKMAVKLIPAYIIFFCVLLVVADLLGLFPGGGVISTQGILALALSIVAGIALVGDIAAWAAYRIYKRKARDTI